MQVELSLYCLWTNKTAREKLDQLLVRSVHLLVSCRSIFVLSDEVDMASEAELWRPEEVNEVPGGVLLISPYLHTPMKWHVMHMSGARATVTSGHLSAREAQHLSSLSVVKVAVCCKPVEKQHS